MKRVALLLVICVGAYWLLLFLLQRLLLFPGASYSVAIPRPTDAEQHWLPFSGGRVEAWYLPPLDSAPGPAPLILFAHGNGEVIDFAPADFEEPRRWGIGVLLVEYPGYGRSDGAPSRSSIREAFEAAYTWAASAPGIDTSRIIYYGQSLGTGAVSDLSMRHPPAALILHSGFTRIADFAWRMAAPPFLIRDRFDNLTAVRSLRGPRLILHGSRDEVIPVEQGKRLAEAAGVPLVVLPCGHNDCRRPWPEIRVFLEEAMLLRKPS